MLWVNLLFTDNVVKLFDKHKMQEIRVIIQSLTYTELFTVCIIQHWKLDLLVRVLVTFCFTLCFTFQLIIFPHACTYKHVK